MKCTIDCAPIHIYTLYTISQSPGIHPISQYKYTPSILTQCTVQLWIILSWYIPNIKSGILHAKLYLYSRSVPNRLIQAALLDKYCVQSNIENTQTVKTDLLPVCFFSLTNEWTCYERNLLSRLKLWKWPWHLFRSERIHAMSTFITQSHPVSQDPAVNKGSNEKLHWSFSKDYSYSESEYNVILIQFHHASCWEFISS